MVSLWALTEKMRSCIVLPGGSKVTKRHRSDSLFAEPGSGDSFGCSPETFARAEAKTAVCLGVWCGFPVLHIRLR